MINGKRFQIIITQHPQHFQPKKMKTNLCIPRLRSGNTKNKNNNNNNSTNLTPAMTLLERFREAVLRLIMLSALSRDSSTLPRHHHTSSRHVSTSRSCYYNSAADPHHSEAVADCIEFIKKKALNGEDDEADDRRGSEESRRSCDGDDDDHCIDTSSTDQLGIPVTVM
ncbi:Steroid receptor seven-up, A like [Melia azedarach]|uniref:Steroid receptor seven-up, A like n=1 Tax=Melia azedarach TaxID=155640 RepID=A0ACC1XXE1_MELAZ|nr:Steroid receptor seven-up, A like [Melia azedarach]